MLLYPPHELQKRKYFYNVCKICTIYIAKILSNKNNFKQPNNHFISTKEQDRYESFFLWEISMTQSFEYIVTIESVGHIL